MKTKPFLLFVLPSLVMMALFIALPLVRVFVQSFQLTQNVFEVVERERCDPFGCTTETETIPQLDEAGNPVTQTVWVGLENYRALLQPEVLRNAFQNQAFGTLANLPFYRALRFTLTFTLLTLPCVIVVGLALALSIDTLARALRGPVIFVTLLPFIITPVIGALSIRWLFVGDGILTAGLERLLNQNITMFAQGWTVELLMLFYRVWHVAPFAFIIFYAGLQTLPGEWLEAARVDGAGLLQRLRHIVLPALGPLIVFVSLIHLMDTYRVFDEVIGFRAEAFRISLQWLTYNFLTPDDAGNRSIGRASASAILTMIGIVILLVPLLRTTWKEQRG